MSAAAERKARYRQRLDRGEMVVPVTATMALRDALAVLVPGANVDTRAGIAAALATVVSRLAQEPRNFSGRVPTGSFRRPR